MAWLYYPTEFERACLGGVSRFLHREKNEEISDHFEWKNGVDECKRGSTFFHRGLYLKNNENVEYPVLTVGSISMEDPGVFIVDGENIGNFRDLDDGQLAKLFDDPQRTGVLSLSFPKERNKIASEREYSVFYSPEAPFPFGSSETKEKSGRHSPTYRRLTKRAEEMIHRDKFVFHEVADFTERSLGVLAKAYELQPQK